MVITADDFGLAREVNEAVEIAHKRGILSAASLMVVAPEAKDAVSRARSMPGLRVGLHLALTDATPVLPPEKIPRLVDHAGRLRADLARLGLDLALDARARRQLHAEIEAQFSAFRATGLTLDHVNAHQHYHLHPIVAAMVIEIGLNNGMRALRTPSEPRRVIALADQPCRASYRTIESACAALLRRRAKRAGLATLDGVLGLRWSGQMTAPRLQACLAGLPPGSWEIYFHPATRDSFPGHAPGYRYAEELAALVDPRSVEALRRSKFRVGGYGDLLE